MIIKYLQIFDYINQRFNINELGPNPSIPRFVWKWALCINHNDSDKNIIDKR